MTARVDLTGPPLSAPRDIDTAQLTGAVENGEHCPSCREAPVAGMLAWEDGGPHQLLSVRTYRCGAGHEWEVATDGG